MLTAAILLSHQPLRPHRNCAWVQGALKAAAWIKERDYALITSTGMQTWELLLYLAARDHIPQKIVLPSTSDQHFLNQCCTIRSAFHPCEGTFEFIPLIFSGGKEAGMRARDSHVFLHSDILFPVSIRKNGSLSRLLTYHAQRGTQVDSQFERSFQKRSVPLKYALTETLDKRLHACTGYLIHWTRSCSGPWPGESLLSFYSAVTNADTYPRDAFSTLKQILQSQRIRSSSRHMQKGVSTVSFTAKPPLQFLSHMRWRARYTEMSFEPYGIGIQKSYALERGIVPVVYTEKVAGNGEKTWFHQSNGKNGEWYNEHEYRCRGDFDLSLVPSEKLICFCHKPHEAKEIESRWGIETVAITA